MSDLTMDAILKDCELTLADMFGMVPGTTDEIRAHMSASFVKVHSFLLALHADVKKEEKKDESAEKIDPPHVKTWKADKKSAALAQSIVAKILADLAKYEGNDALMFHLRAELRDTLVKYVANEVEYGEWKAERNVPNVAVLKGTKQVNAERYKVGVKGLEDVWGLKGHELTLPTEVDGPNGTKVPLLTSDKGKLVPNLPPLGGNFGGNGSGASGRYAPLYSKITYSVDGKGYTDPREVVRAIWTGKARIGKNTADLWTLIEKKKINPATITDPVTFTEAGHSVIVSKKKEN